MKIFKNIENGEGKRNLIILKKKANNYSGKIR